VIESAVEEQAIAVGRTNVSRAISDLVRAGMMTRHYEGYATNHENRGGGRHAVYVVAPHVLELQQRSAVPQAPVFRTARVQGELFAA